MTNGAEEEAAQPTQPAEMTEPPPPPPAEGAAPSGTPPTRGGWMVPKWVVAALVGVVAVGIIFGSAFAIGRATASGGGDEHGRIERGFGGMDRNSLRRRAASSSACRRSRRPAASRAPRSRTWRAEAPPPVPDFNRV